MDISLALSIAGDLGDFGGSIFVRTSRLGVACLLLVLSVDDLEAARGAVLGRAAEVLGMDKGGDRLAVVAAVARGCRGSVCLTGSRRVYTSQHLLLRASTLLTFCFPSTLSSGW